MTTSTFKYLDLSTVDVNATAPFEKCWSKVDGGGSSFQLADHNCNVTNIRPDFDHFGTDVSGFSVFQAPAKEKAFTDDAAVRNGYYAEVEQLVRQKLAGVKKLVLFDHTIRKHDPTSPRQPVQQVHVDQTPQAAEARVRRHVPADEAEEVLNGRYQIINVWRPIGHPASDFPLAVIDWRSTKPADFVKMDLLYPKRNDDDNDDRGKEKVADVGATSTDGYEVRGETFGVAPSDEHKFYYVKDMRPDEAMFIKCFDSRSQIQGGEKGVADCTPHTAFVDPDTPKDAKGRQSIEVRCLVFYE